MILDNALYIVSTPIGNLGDISFRAIDVLKACDFIAAEDTRHSLRLMRHYGIDTRLEAYHDFSSVERAKDILDRILNGASVALISDAGTPLISDPGFRLVHLAQGSGVRVCSVPGACALIAALSISGLPSDKFMFEGFFPVKQLARERILNTVKSASWTSIFYESPHRIIESLQSFRDVLGSERSITLVREITKKFETVVSGSVSDVIQTLEANSEQTKGEMVVLVKGAESLDVKELTAETRNTMSVLMAELPLKQAASLAAKLTGAKKNALYKWGLSQEQ